MRPAWLPDWSGETAAIIASGPSAQGQPLHLLASCRVVVINDSWKLYPAADLLYGCDANWWRLKGPPNFAGLKVTQDVSAARRFGLQHAPLKHVHTLSPEPGVIGSGGNSGFQALNLVVETGVRRILLVGFDMHLAAGSHWHGDHAAPLNNPRLKTVALWRDRLDAIAPQLAERGVEVLNATPGSALNAYPRIDLAAAVSG